MVEGSWLLLKLLLLLLLKVQVLLLMMQVQVELLMMQHLQRRPSERRRRFLGWIRSAVARRRRWGGGGRVRRSRRWRGRRRGSRHGCRGGVDGGRGLIGGRFRRVQRDRHPRVIEDVIEGDSVVGPQAEAAADEVLALVGETGAELDLGVADLLILLERDVAADHVVEEDPQAPDGGGVGVVTGAADPLGRSVDTGSCKRQKRKKIWKNC